MAKDLLQDSCLEEFSQWLLHNGWKLLVPNAGEILHAVQFGRAPIVLHTGKTPGRLSVPQKSAGCVNAFLKQQRIKKRTGMALGDIIAGLENLENEINLREGHMLSDHAQVVRAAISALGR